MMFIWSVSEAHGGSAGHFGWWLGAAGILEVIQDFGCVFEMQIMRKTFAVQGLSRSRIDLMPYHPDA